MPFSEVRVLDRNAQSLGVSTETLMENAGKGVADVILRMTPYPHRVLVICGPGNNGGDGLVAARYLADKTDVRVLLVRPREEMKSRLTRMNLDRLPSSVPVHDLDELNRDLIWADLLIDAMLGTGISGDLREPYLSTVRKINDCGKRIISVDCPSGLGATIRVRPDLTVTFHDLKEGMEDIDDVIVVDIGIPEEAVRYTGPGELTLIPPPERDAHKGDAGRVLIIGGGPYSGAPALCGMAALRTGADLAFIASPEPAASIIATYSPNLIVRRMGSGRITMDDFNAIDAILPDVSAIAIGPGLGRAEETIKAVCAILERASELLLPAVIDADALLALSYDIPHLDGVITPHRGEMRQILGKFTDQDVIDYASKTGLTVLLKGPEDLITDGERTKWNRTGNPGMTVGGTGDVLTGIVVALLSKGMTPFDAARTGAYICGRGGDLAFEKLGFSLLATDVIDAIPRVLLEVIEREPSSQ